MAVLQVTDPNTIAPLFAGREDTLIWSYLQGCMGEAFADDLQEPQSAVICVGGFMFFAGRPDPEMVAVKPASFTFDCVLMVPPSRDWEEVIEAVLGERAHRWVRYATKKDKTAFDLEKLAQYAAGLPPGFELRPIDKELYDRILKLPWAWDMCGHFPSCEAFAAHALGFVILHQGEVVAGASTYSYYHGGIEVEIDTRQDYRRRGLATICGAALILECLARGLYPNWDAHNRESIALAQKLGYVFDREYTCYEVYPWRSL
ncbi:MAG TPA: GNAT family N-acetyltransferase [Firmicutes bacterium]|jgi:GNAT superfamily N-acetyltransferase|nr:GNAT family N-acetyltransferase [Bacillota bacterium]